jgi:regulator of protease activity HflC (stomatin/prohibitin superfamily)
MLCAHHISAFAASYLDNKRGAQAVREVNYTPPSSSSVFRLGLSVLVGLVIAYLAFGSWYQVDQGERAVVLRFGELVGESGSGFHFKLPWVDSVRRITVQTQTKRYQNLDAYSRDQQPADLTVSVTYVVSNASEVYAQYGDLEVAVLRLIDPRLTAGIKTIFGQYDAVRAIQERAALNNDFATAVTAAIDGGPINIISVQIENIDFSDAYEQSVEQRCSLRSRSRSASRTCALRKSKRRSRARRPKARPRRPACAARPRPRRSRRAPKRCE